MPPDDTSNAADLAGDVRLSVLAPLPLAGAYDYRAAPGLDLKPGDFVRVPLGSRNVAGVVW